MPFDGLKQCANVVATVAQAELKFITGNAGKVRELQLLLEPKGIKVVQDDRDYPEIQADTLEDVSSAAVEYLLANGAEPPFVIEDAGLFVSALQGFPGVYSRHALDTIGCAGVLKLLQDVELESRTAAFRACLTYVDEGREFRHFNGSARGSIATRAAGTNGFGFDSIFVPFGYDKTFAEMTEKQKGVLSHRGQAARSFVEHL
jgi:XTP/dITP diphosphohydrolase